MASQRDYNIGAAAVLRLIQDNIYQLLVPAAADNVARAVIDAVDADREIQKKDRDN